MGGGEGEGREMAEEGRREGGRKEKKEKQEKREEKEEVGEGEGREMAGAGRWRLEPLRWKMSRLRCLQCERRGRG